jgi:hypothetical protein
VPRPAQQRAGRTASRFTAILAMTVITSLIAVPSAFAAELYVDDTAQGVFIYITLSGQSTTTSANSPELYADSSDPSTTPQESALPSYTVPGALTSGEVDATLTSPAPSRMDSEVSLADVTVPGIFTADSVTAYCTAQASGESGYATFENAKVGGVPVPDDPAPNTQITVPGLAVVTLDYQGPYVTPDGQGSLVVRAIDVTGLDGFGDGWVDLGTAICDGTYGQAYLPVGTLGGLLLTGVLGAIFTVRQLRRRPV